jgi:hypothetical protein
MVQEAGGVAPGIHETSVAGATLESSSRHTDATVTVLAILIIPSFQIEVLHLRQTAQGTARHSLN